MLAVSSSFAARPVQALRRPQPASSRPSRASALRVSAHSITFQFPNGDTNTIPCSPDRYILDAAEEAGLSLPHSCTAGTCCACAVRVVSGQVDTADQVYLDDEQLAAGFALICSTRPLSDVTVLTHQEEVLHTSAY